MVASPGDTQPVFDLIARQAAKLCEVPIASVAIFDGAMVHLVAQSGFDPAYAYVFAEQFPRPPSQDFAMGRAILNRRVEQIEDTSADTRRGFTPPPGPGSALAVPLLRDGTPLGVIAVGRRVRGLFSENQITLLQTFAEQAVIAMENARLITEQREALEQQTATAEVLQVINASPGDLAPVFDAVLERALRLCAASFGTLLTYDGEHIERVALLGVPPAFAEWGRGNPLTKNAALISRGIATGKPVQATDVTTDTFLAASPSVRDALVELGGVRALLQVPLLKDAAVVGFIGIFRREPGAFPDKQIALLEGFAAQAVIAMENARLLTEQQRGAGAADRDRRGAAGDQRVAWRSRTGLCSGVGKGDTALRVGVWDLQLLRRRMLPRGRDAGRRSWSGGVSSGTLPVGARIGPAQDRPG